MNLFLVLPNQLFSERFDDYFECDEIVIAEEMRYFAKGNTANVSIRAAMRKFYALLIAERKRRNSSARITYVDYHTLASRGGIDVFDYLTGCKMIVNMYDLSDYHAWGDKPRTIKYSGLPIRFLPSPMFIVSAADIFTNYKSGAKINFASFCSKFGLPPIQKVDGGKYQKIKVDATISAAKKYIEELFGEKVAKCDYGAYSAEVAQTYLLKLDLAAKIPPPIIFAANFGIISPQQLYTLAKNAAHFICRREYIRAIYLLNFSGGDIVEKKEYHECDFGVIEKSSNFARFAVREF